MSGYGKRSAKQSGKNKNVGFQATMYSLDHPAPEQAPQEDQDQASGILGAALQGDQDHEDTDSDGIFAPVSESDMDGDDDGGMITRQPELNAMDFEDGEDHEDGGVIERQDELKLEEEPTDKRFTNADITGVEQGKPKQDLGADGGSWGALKEGAKQAHPRFSALVHQLSADTAALEKRMGPEMVPAKPKKIKKEDLDGKDAKAKIDHRREVHKHNKDLGKGGRQMVPNNKTMSGPAGLKGQDRADQKAEGKYKGKYDSLLDVVRGTLTFKDFPAMRDALVTIWEKKGDYNYDIARCKQTYTVDDKGSMHKTLYGDVKLNIVEGETGHICELQLTIEAMVEAKGKGHKPYEQYRDANPFDDKIGNLAEEDQRAAKAAVRKSHEIYGPVRKVLNNAPGYQDIIATAEGLQKHIQGDGPLPDGFQGG